MLRWAWQRVKNWLGGEPGEQVEAGVSEVLPEMEPGAPCVFYDLKIVSRNCSVHKNANWTDYLHRPCPHSSLPTPSLLGCSPSPLTVPWSIDQQIQAIVCGKQNPKKNTTEGKKELVHRISLIAPAFGVLPVTPDSVRCDYLIKILF